MISEKNSQKSISENSSEKSESTSIWHKPVWGKNSLIEEVFQKDKIDQEVIKEHDNALSQLKNIAIVAEVIDANMSNDEKDFSFSTILKYSSNTIIKGYEDIEDNIKLLDTAMRTKQDFCTIEEIEAVYRSGKQQRFYDLIVPLLSKFLDNKTEFINKVKEEYENTFNSIKTEKGQIALKSYLQSLESIAKEELGLKLLYNFKQRNLADLSTLRELSDLVVKLSVETLQNSKALEKIVQANYKLFEEVSELIKIPKYKQNKETYKVLLQHTGFVYKDKKSYSQFQEIIKILQDWVVFYRSLINIRSHYPHNKYQQPESFKTKVPGIELYGRYQDHLHKSHIYIKS